LPRGERERERGWDWRGERVEREEGGERESNKKKLCLSWMLKNTPDGGQGSYFWGLR
jgi:hypothetical protein